MTASAHIVKAEDKIIDRVTPLDDFIFCTHTRRNNRIGSLYIPDECREDIQYGIALAVGRGERRENGLRMPMTVKVGDKILWAKHWERPVDLDRDEKYAAVREKDVIGIISQKTGAFKPLYNTIVIEPDALPSREGRLYLPPQVKRPLMPAMHGTVIDHGPGHRMKDGSILPLEVKKGSRVAFAAYAGEDHEFAGRMLRLIPEEHVLLELIP